MKIFKPLIISLFFGMSLIACTSSNKNTDESDSALLSRTDTLGGDTTRQSSVADSSTASKIDTSQKKQ